MTTHVAGRERGRREEAARASRGASAGPIYQAVLAALDRCRAAGTALDFGAGTGTLARLLCEQDRFTQVVAADLVDFGANVAHPKLSWQFGDLNLPLVLPDGSFDVIAAVEVIEHLENPRAMVRDCFRLLRPGGVLLLSTPNNESWRAVIALLGKRHFVDFADASYPAHITALLPLDLRRICREAGLEQITFSFTDFGTLPRLTRWTWQQISFGALRGRRYSNNVVCTARKPRARQPE